jgi:flagellar protein FliS
MNVKQSYREAAVQGASPVELVVRLYEQMIEDLRQASAAIEKKDTQQRTNRIRHAILIVGHLQSSLDFGNGGKVAQDLDNFYDVLRQNLLQVQFSPSKGRVRQLITDLLAVREAWLQVAQAENSGPGRAPAANAANGTVPGGMDVAADHVPMEWQG